MSISTDYDQLPRKTLMEATAERQYMEREVAAHQVFLQSHLADRIQYPNNMLGRGIVICAGGHRHFTNAWVCLRMLRRLGCDLPVQLWHLGECEMDDRMRELVRPCDVECIDGEDITQYHPVRRLGGWELKPFAILHSPFREVILLDADNVPLVNPEFLFDTPQYKEHGAIFWPDFNRLQPDREIWDICQVEYHDEPEFESGQIVVDKRRCWEALNLTMHYNEHSDFYYQHIHGDKETFHMAFRRVNKSYAMPERGIDALHCTMCQHDFDGRRIFQHRNMDKWRLDGKNRRIDGFREEEQCFKYLEELRNQWNGRVMWNDNPTFHEQRAIDSLAGQTLEYERVGHDKRNIELLPDRTIGEGAGGLEQTWTVINTNGHLSLVIHGEESPTCRLVPHYGAWHGHWYRHERMPIVVRQLTE